MTYIVTGAAGFVGANIVRALNARGEKNIIAVDDLRPADNIAIWLIWISQITLIKMIF